MWSCRFSRRSPSAFSSSLRRRAPSRVRSSIFGLGITACLTTLVMTPVGTNIFHTGFAAGPPLLLTQASSTRAIALDSVTNLAEPFPLQSPIGFGGDGRTRVMLFATNLTSSPLQLSPEKSSSLLSFCASPNCLRPKGSFPPNFRSLILLSTANPAQHSARRNAKIFVFPVRSCSMPSKNDR